MRLILDTWRYTKTRELLCCYYCRHWRLRRLSYNDKIQCCRWRPVRHRDSSLVSERAILINKRHWLLIWDHQHHDSVIKWKHFPRYWPFVRGIHRPGDFPSQRTVTRRFNVFFDLRLNKRLSKQSKHRWFETLSRSLWRHCNDGDSCKSTSS